MDYYPMHRHLKAMRRAHLELIAQDLSVDLGGDALIVEVAQLGVVIDLQLLLANTE